MTRWFLLGLIALPSCVTVGYHQREMTAAKEGALRDAREWVSQYEHHKITLSDLEFLLGIPRHKIKRRETDL